MRARRAAAAERQVRVRHDRLIRRRRGDHERRHGRLVIGHRERDRRSVLPCDRSTDRSRPTPPAAYHDQHHIRTAAGVIREPHRHAVAERAPLPARPANVPVTFLTSVNAAPAPACTRAPPSASCCSSVVAAAGLELIVTGAGAGPLICIATCDAGTNVASSRAESLDRDTGASSPACTGSLPMCRCLRASPSWRRTAAACDR